MHLHLVSIPEEQDNMDNALHKCLVIGMPWAHVLDARSCLGASHAEQCLLH